jgi:hypothetical protein
VTVIVLVNDPLVPVTTTLKDPTFVGLIVRVESPDPVMLAVSRTAVTPEGLESLRVTAEEKPLSRLRLMMEVVWDPVFVERFEGFAERLKSWNVNCMDVL